MIRRGEVMEILLRPLGMTNAPEEIKEAHREAIEALQRRTPMKPYRNIVHYPYRSDMEIVQCPRCKRRLRTSRMTKSGDAYCPDCGQAIDWTPDESRLQANTLLMEEAQNGGSD